MVRPIVVTIDGPAGAGKSTASRALAARLGFLYLDTGAIYRAVALAASEDEALGARIDASEGGNEMSPVDRRNLSLLARSLDIQFTDGGTRVRLGQRDVTELIRTPEISQRASKISAVPEVRTALLEVQRRIGAAGGVVVEGRDVGTVVFPDAAVKFFLTADPGERARRRVAELHARGLVVDEANVRHEIEARDARDAGRAVAPLVCPPDAIVIDSSTLSEDAVVARMVGAVTSRDCS